MSPPQERRMIRFTVALAVALVASNCAAALPRPVALAFLRAGVPLAAIGVVVQEVKDARPFAHQPLVRKPPSV